ncbi:hypothetical protein CGCA056_v002151 [Colletotrichum aenigma]|uniref:uncharacterized protein n=1 Tax=Colletotrichum aenigma TaxID=1215731 RepID=UPI001872EB62|nr:uncharacterized protein CGCA056_v002151 [Colletotrichum aenigma]KAF5526537.1 hypothetical protein CGCA056_v002151 [Colletotrichum aenigma]
MKKLACCGFVPYRWNAKKAESDTPKTDTVPSSRPVSASNVSLPVPPGPHHYPPAAPMNRANTGSFSSRGNARTPDSFFDGDINLAEYADDAEDDDNGPNLRDGPIVRLVRRLSTDNKNVTGSNPPANQNPEALKELKRRKAAEDYRASVRLQNHARIQAEIRSENSGSRSVSTRGSKRVRELATVMEDANDQGANDRTSSITSHHSQQWRKGLEFYVATSEGVRGVGYQPPRTPHHPITRPPAARLRNDHTGNIRGDRRRGSFPRPDLGRASASQIVLRERGSLPAMPPPPVLTARQTPDGQDDASFRSWNLSQNTVQGDSQATISNRTGDVSTGTTQNTSISDIQGTSQSKTRRGEPSQGNKQAACTPDSVTASNYSRASESSQSQEGEALNIWLLTQDSQETLAPANEQPAKGEPVSRETVCNGNLPNTDKENTHSPISAGLPASGTSGELTIKAFPRDESSSTDLESALAMNLDMEDEMDRNTRTSEEMSVRVQEPDQEQVYKQTSENAEHEPKDKALPAQEDPIHHDNNEEKGKIIVATNLASIPQYQSSSVYSSTQNTRQTSPDGSKEPSSEEGARYSLESFKGLELSPFSVPKDVRQEGSDDTYRTAASKRSGSDPVIPPIAVNQIVSDSVEKSQNKLAPTTPTPTASHTHSRKSSFLNLLLHRAESSSIGHRKSKSQPSAKLTPLNNSPEALDIPKRLSHAKKLSNLSIRSHMQPISAADDFAAPPLRESATVVWKRAFELEHNLRDKSVGPAHSETTVVSPVPDDDADKDIAVKDDGDINGGNDAFTAGTQFASHTREERNAAAGSTDLVKQKDFALASTTYQQSWITDMKMGANGYKDEEAAHSLSKKFGKAMKTGLTKMVQSKPKGKSAELEYPELEILPTKGGYKDVEAIQRSVATLSPRLRAKMATHPAQALADMENESRQYGGAHHTSDGSADNAALRNDKSKDVGTSAKVALSIRPVTPASLAIAPNGDLTTPTTTEHWATPASRLSFSSTSHTEEGYISAVDDIESIGKLNLNSEAEVQHFGFFMFGQTEIWQKNWYQSLPNDSVFLVDDSFNPRTNDNARGLLMS